MKRPRILRTHLVHHYVHGRGESNEHGLFGNGLFPSMGWDEVFQSFESLGSPLCFDKTREHGPYDAAFFMPYQTPPLWIREVVGPDAPIICWVADDVWRFDFTRALIAAGAADHYITTAPEALLKYDAAGMREHVTLSAFGTRPDWWPRLVTRAETAKAEATFTGLMYGDRLARLQAIAGAGEIPVDAYDTQGDVIPLADYHQHMADSAFTLCLTASSHGPPQMKARLFEPQIHGSVLVTEPLAELADYWEPDVECLVFTSPKEAQAKMTAILNDAAAYQDIAERAFRRAITEHSYQARFAAVFDQLGLSYTMPDFRSLLPLSDEAVLDSAP